MILGKSSFGERQSLLLGQARAAADGAVDGRLGQAKSYAHGGAREAQRLHGPGTEEAALPDARRDLAGRHQVRRPEAGPGPEQEMNVIGEQGPRILRSAESWLHRPPRCFVRGEGPRPCTGRNARARPSPRTLPRGADRRPSSGSPPDCAVPVGVSPILRTAQ